MGAEILDKLHEKIEDLLIRLALLEEENKELQLKNATLATQNEEKGRQLDTLYDEIAAQDNRVARNL